MRLSSKPKSESEKSKKPIVGSEITDFKQYYDFNRYFNGYYAPLYFGDGFKNVKFIFDNAFNQPFIRISGDGTDSSYKIKDSGDTFRFYNQDSDDTDPEDLISNGDYDDSDCDTATKNAGNCQEITL